MATYYWVGGSGTWNAVSNTRWASSSGGSGGAGVPTSSDDVYFDSNSGAGTVTIDTGTCRSVDCTGFTGTWASPSIFTWGTLAVYGDFKLASGMTNDFWGTITFAATTSKNITTNGKTIKGAITFDGAGGSWVLQDNLTQTRVYGNAIVTLTRGTFDANGNNVTLYRFNAANNNTKTIALGSGSWTVTGEDDPGSSIYSWNLLFSTNTTITGSAIITFNVSSGTASFFDGYYTWPGVTQSGASWLYLGVNSGTSAPTITTLSRTANAGPIYIRQYTDVTVTNVNLSGSGPSDKSNIYGTGIPSTLTKSSGSLANLFYINVNNVAAFGAGWLAYTINGNTVSGLYSPGWVTTNPGNFLEFID